MQKARNKQALLFLKKRSKKLLLIGGFGAGVATTRRTKSFLVLFSKKNFLLNLLETP
jgi:hypothetical protein